MRILLLTPIFPPGKGGAAQDFGHLSRIFRADETVTEILVLSNRRRGATLYRKEGKVGHLRILNYDFYHDPLFSFRWNVRVIQDIVKRYSPHAIVFHSVILPFRDYYAELFRDIGEAKLYLYKTDLFPVPYFPRLNGIVYISENIGRMLRRQGVPVEKLIYIPLLFRPPRAAGKPVPYPFKYILFVGSTDPLKGFFQLFKAFEMLREKHRQLKLLVVGPDPLGAVFDPDILFVNELSRGRVSAYIRGASVVVVPSFSEGLPRTALETLYLKKPLVITGIVEETRRLGPGQVLESNEPGEIAEKLGAILNGAPYSCDFPWENLAFKPAADAWLKLLETSRLTGEARPPDGPPSAGPVSADKLMEFYNHASSKMSIKDMDGVFQLKVLQTTAPAHADGSIAAVVDCWFLLNREKKNLLKKLLTRLWEDSRVVKTPRRLDRLFAPLAPLTADDYLFLGDYSLKTGNSTAAKEFYFHGLNEGPHSVHLDICTRLLEGLEGADPGIDPDRRAELEKRRRVLKKNVCRFLEKKRNKTERHHYRLASLHKQLREYKAAARGFKRLAVNAGDRGIRAGACFHLGELALKTGEKTSAKKQFKKCLRLNPSHGKAARYVGELGKC